jgi:hypothetical protein
MHVMGELFRRDSFSVSLMADVIILAEAASQITMGEKYGARSRASYQRCFLSKMGKGV